MTLVGFTRPADRLEAGMVSCKKFGFSCLCAPSLDPRPGSEETFEQVKNLLTNRSAFVTIFASVTAVKVCIEKFGAQNFADLLSTTYIACTGPTTADFLDKKLGRSCDIVPKTYSGEGVAKEICNDVKGKLILILRSDSGDERIVSILKNTGAKVVDAAVYSMVPSVVGEDHIRLMDAIADGDVDAMLFSSPMTFKTFYKQMVDRFGKADADRYLSKVYKVAIGKPTAETMEMLGHAPDAVPEKSTFEGMLLEVQEKFKN